MRWEKWNVTDNNGNVKDKRVDDSTSWGGHGHIITNNKEIFHWKKKDIKIITIFHEKSK